MRALKLNYKRTFLIGFAFFGILLLWQVYDSWCPTFLTDIFANRMYGLTSAELKLSDPSKILNVQWLVGIIMACDNLAALILKQRPRLERECRLSLSVQSFPPLRSRSSRCFSITTASEAWLP